MCRKETDLPATLDDYEAAVFLLGEMVKEQINLYENCILCPRQCNAKRSAGIKGYCKESEKLFVSRAALHMWEEPCISGAKGSGAVFFAGCPLHCVFCQNKDISFGNAGKEISLPRLVEIFFELEAKGANNINLVTPTHYTPTIVTAIKEAKKSGLKIPFVYNTSGYESVETLSMLEGLVDVFLPDFKYFESETARIFSLAPDYPEVAKTALEKMVNMVGTPSFNENGIIQKGVIVRVLVLPAHTNEAIKIVRYLYEKYSDQIYISIMSQYTPLADSIPNGKEYDCLRRSLTKREYEKVINSALELGVTNAFFQEGKVNKESFIPAFDCEGV